MPKFMSESDDSDFMGDEGEDDEAFYSDDEELSAKPAKPAKRNASMTSSKTPMATSMFLVMP